ncbi:diaminopimelate decarboxylase [Trichothermofontia sichuanensis B231]|uniref:diaminopimelate decarboxylase n=1 Tax=Trichothermofontia sichuanensis TaxID=3045816 RepID=UPI0022471749|nr:diaminopimelate decarboxylase [Trichothermofontia sichuanensis]UZQ54596.1 diaminopimelate decarboxylase [Trichothermofontia sichuanensis B231]
MLCPDLPLTPPASSQYLPDLPNPADDQSTASPNQFLLPLTARINAQDHLEIGGCDVVTLVQQWESPLYVLDELTLRTACRQYREALQRHYPGESLVLYASKAWNCLAVCAIVAQEGLGIDVVSGGELYTALKAGVDPRTIYLHGNNKSTTELRLAVASGCVVVVDNWLDLHTLVDLLATENNGSQSWPTPVRVMIRFTPGIECHTHEYIRTGHLDSKFGFDPDQLPEVFAFLSQQSGLTCIGLHAHIGSQIFECQPHQDLARVMVQAFSKAASYGLPVQEINVGGGLGIRYTESDDPPSISAWVEAVSTALVAACEAQDLPYPRLLCEPGRSLIGPAGVTAYTVGSQKHIPGMRTYVTIDGGMSDNPRPITYQSLYRVVAAEQMSAPLSTTVTLAGKHCESGDILIQQAQLPPVRSGEVVVVPATGAYNYSMASNYNRLPRPAAILVADGEAKLIIRRETYADLMRQDCLPVCMAPLETNEVAQS